MNMSPDRGHAPRHTAIARGRAYDLLADLFRDGPARLDHLRAVAVLAPHLPESFDDDAKAWHHRVMVHEVSPHAGVFLHPEGLVGGDTADESLGTMRAGGFSPDTRSVPADHLSASLGYLSWLCGAEADAWRDGEDAVARRVRGRAHVFIETQLYRWLPPLVAAIEGVDPGLYGAAARLLVDLTADHLGREPEPVPLPVSVRNVLDERGVGVREIARYLAVPVNAGALLTPTWMREVAREAEGATGFGTRAQRLEGMLQTGARRGQAPQLLGALHTRLEGMAERLDALPCGAPWADRVYHSANLVQTMQAAVSEAS